MKLTRQLKPGHSIVDEYNALETFLTALGYNTNELTMDEAVKLKLAIQEVVEGKQQLAPVEHKPFKDEWGNSDWRDTGEMGG